MDMLIKLIGNISLAGKNGCNQCNRPTFKKNSLQQSGTPFYAGSQHHPHGVTFR